MLFTLFLLCLASFSAGFVDAIVGGGGLIQLPISILLLPQYPVNLVIGTLKIPAFSGTSFAAYHYTKKQPPNWKLMGWLMPLAFIASYTGSYALTMVSNAFMKPLLLVILSIVAVYTFVKKDFGQKVQNNLTSNQLYIYAIAIILIIGLYDGFVGPGTGSFLILSFISILGFDFLQASAKAKLINLATNLGSIILFIIKGKIIWHIAICMAISNSIGGILGAKLAIKKGNTFIRILFLLVVTATLLRFAYDIWFK